MSRPNSPAGLSGTGSPSRLVLLPDTDEHDPHGYAIDDDDEHDDDPQLGTEIPVPPLSSSVVFLYLLSPYLRLGAIYAFDIRDAPLAYGLVGLVVAASLSAFCRQVWFLLGRYVRKSSTEEILVHAFSRTHQRRVRGHSVARAALITISAMFKVSLASMYLRDAVDSAFLLDLPESVMISFPSRLTLSCLLFVVIFILSFPKSLASQSAMYTTGLSVASYLAWLVAVCRSYGADELLLPSLGSFRRGVLWTEISSLVFACSTTMTVPLSASLLAGMPLIPPASKNARARSFQSLNILSTILAALLTIPLVVIAARPRAPATAATSNNLILSLRIITLVSSIPSVVVSVTSHPSPGSLSQFLRTNTALSIINVSILGLSLVPRIIASTLGDAMLFSAVISGFLLPGLAHITIHYFRRPLAIVVPQASSSVPSTPRPSNIERSPSPSRDPLLQRKERLLQRSRFGKRLFWDLSIWAILIPVCAGALFWAADRLVRQPSL